MRPCTITHQLESTWLELLTLVNVIKSHNSRISTSDACYSGFKKTEFWIKVSWKASLNQLNVLFFMKLQVIVYVTWMVMTRASTNC